MPISALGAIAYRLAQPTIAPVLVRREVAVWRRPPGWRSIWYEKGVLGICPWIDLEVWMAPGGSPCVGTLVVCGRVWWAAEVPHKCQWGDDWPRQRAFIVKWIKQQVAAAGQKKLALSEQGQAWVDAHEALWEYLTCDMMPDGSERLTSMLCVLVEGGMVKAALQDRQEGLSLWAAAQSIPEVLDALEARLRAGDGDWRPMRGQAPTKGRNNRR